MSGAFSAAARAAIYEASGHRCAGCGAPDITAQHRRARQMGGTSNEAIRSPANGVALCGSGTTGCHGWAEGNPAYGELLGWVLRSGVEAEGAPYWTRFGWVAWQIEDDGFPSITGVYDADLDRLGERKAALAAYARYLAVREAS